MEPRGRGEGAAVGGGSRCVNELPILTKEQLESPARRQPQEQLAAVPRVRQRERERERRWFVRRRYIQGTALRW